MAEVEEEEKVETVFIPNNITEGIDAGGLTLNPRRTFEAVLGGVLGGFLTYGLLVLINQYFKIDIETRIAVIVMGVALFMAICYFGANNETFSQCIVHIIQFNKRKRIAYYNPRVKAEIKSVAERTDIAEEQLVPRDKIQRFIDNYQMNASKRTSARIAEIENEHKAEGRMYFEDDIGVITPPDGYMTKSEKKKLAKAQKRKKKTGSKKKKKGGKR